MTLVIALAIGKPLMAQSDRPTLSVGWVQSPPLWQLGSDGKKSGYFIELAQLIADEIDHDLIVKEYQTVEDLIVAQNAGETDLIAGGTALAVFEESNLFSIPLGRARSRMFVHADQADDFDLDTLSGQVVGIAGQGWAPEVADVLDRNIQALLPTAAAGLMGVLSGEYAAIFYPEETIIYWSQISRIDHLVVPVGAPFNIRDRVVILHRSHSNLLDPINATIERLEAAGTLASLRSKFRMEFQDPEPEVLTVAFPDFAGAGRGPTGFAPTYVLDENGEPSGYGIELFRDVADRAGLKYEFKPVSAALMMQGPAAAGVDIVPMLGLSTTRRAIMDQTLPAGSLAISATIRRDDMREIVTPSDLSGRKIGALRGSFAEIQVRQNKTFELVTFDHPDQMLQALLDGQVDAALMLRLSLSKLQEVRGDSHLTHELAVPIYTANRAISLRFGLGQVRERLNKELPVYLLSPEFADLREEYYGVPVFWTGERLRMLSWTLIFLVVVVLSLTLAFLASERARRRERAAKLEAQGANERSDELNSRLQAVMDASSNGVVALGRNGGVSMVNPRAREVLNIDEMSVSSLDLNNQFFSSEDDTTPLAGLSAPFYRALHGAEMQGELFLLRMAGVPQAKYIRISSSSIPVSASSEIGTVIILDDVSEYERQRRETVRAGRMSAVGQLTGGVAHDFNNLLAIIMGNLELVKETPIGPLQDEMIDAGLEATKRGAELTKGLLAFSRQSKLKVEDVDLNEVVLDAQKWMRRALPESIAVETSLLAGVWRIQIDRASLESALLNLIVNARDAMAGLGSLTIETANVRVDEAYVDSRDEELEPGRYVMLAVSDTGTGIRDQDLDRLFEPFFTTKGPGEGSGIGLSMVLGFVKQSGGTVQVYTELGVGTTFKLYFPASKDQTRPVPKVNLTKTPSAASDTRILLAEDDEKVRAVLEASLRTAGYTVVSASSGDAALELFHLEPKFDLLVTDIVMPGMLQGTGLAKEIRPLQPGIPIIFLSGYAAEATVHGNGLEPEDIRLMKPVPKDELLAAVAKLLGS